MLPFPLNCVVFDRVLELGLGSYTGDYDYGVVQGIRVMVLYRGLGLWCCRG